MRARPTILSIFVLALALGGLAGCGGGADEPAEDTTTEPTATAGDETPPPAPEPEPVAEPEPEPEPPSGPGQLRVVNVVRDEEVGGNVRVLSSDGEVVAEGSSGDTFNVESGQYRVQGEITDDSVLIDTPTHELEGMATVAPGETTETRIEFPVSRVRIEVTRRGRPIRRWRLTVTRQGFGESDEGIVLEPSSEHVAITPGRYDGTLRFGGQQIEVSGLIFQGGATQTVPVNVD